MAMDTTMNIIIQGETYRKMCRFDSEFPSGWKFLISNATILHTWVKVMIVVIVLFFVLVLFLVFVVVCIYVLAIVQVVVWDML